jgi:hypothetical protein
MLIVCCGVCVFCSELRGIDANLIIGEEASHMPQKLYPVIIWPLLGVANTALVLISSPKSANHHVSELMRKVNPEDGDYIFKLVSVSDQCGLCLRNGNQDCSHQMPTIPEHLTSKNALMLMSLYDDSDMAEQELKGNPVSTDEFLFKDFCQRFSWLTLHRKHHFSQAVQVLYSFIDPSGGGGSFATVVTHCHGTDEETGKTLRVITGIDGYPRSETGRGLEEKKLALRRHFLAHRMDSRYTNAFIFVAIEVGANPDLSNDTGYYLLNECGPRIVVVKRIKKTPHFFGVVTTNSEKRKWANHATGLLMSDRIRIAADPLITEDESHVTEMIDEMARYSRRIEKVNEGEDNEGRFKETYSGKAGGKNDDRVTAMLASLWEPEVMRYEEKSEYKDIVKKNNLTFLYPSQSPVVVQLQAACDTPLIRRRSCCLDGLCTVWGREAP